MNERRKQGILLLFPVVVLLLGIIFTTTLFYHTYRQIAYQHISAFCEILLVINIFLHSAKSFWKIPLKPSHSYCLA